MKTEYINAINGMDQTIELNKQLNKIEKEITEAIKQVATEYATKLRQNLSVVYGSDYHAFCERNSDMYWVYYFDTVEVNNDNADFVETGHRCDDDCTVHDLNNKQIRELMTDGGIERQIEKDLKLAAENFIKYYEKRKEEKTFALNSAQKDLADINKKIEEKKILID